MNKYIRFLIKEILLAGHLMSLGAASLTLTLLLILDRNVTLPLFFSIYLFVQPIFWIDRYVGFQNDLEENKERSEHLASYFKYIPFISLIYIIVFTYISIVYISIQNFVFGLILLFTGCLYALVFKKITRYILGFKNFFVATFYVLFLFYGLIFSEQKIDIIPVFILATFVFIRSLEIQIYFDFKDIKEDKKNNLKTFPVTFGSANTLKFISLLNIVSFIPIIVGVMFYDLPYWAMLIGIVMFTFELSIRKLKTKPDLKWFIFVSFEYLIIGIVVFFNFL
jgi:4-hydroxybenzoate polyprenyltransferase